MTIEHPAKQRGRGCGLDVPLGGLRQRKRSLGRDLVRIGGGTLSRGARGFILGRVQGPADLLALGGDVASAFVDPGSRGSLVLADMAATSFASRSMSKPLSRPANSPSASCSVTSSPARRALSAATLSRQRRCRHLHVERPLRVFNRRSMRSSSPVNLVRSAACVESLPSRRAASRSSAASRRTWATASAT